MYSKKGSKEKPRVRLTYRLIKKLVINGFKNTNYSQSKRSGQLSIWPFKYHIQKVRDPVFGEEAV